MKRTKLIALEGELIPPFSEVLIKMKPERALENVTNLAEHNKELENEGLLVFWYVVGNTGLILFRVANVTEEPKIKS